MRSAFLPVLTLTLALPCLACGNRSTSRRDSSSPANGESPSATTEAQWGELENDARQLVQAAEMPIIGEPLRLDGNAATTGTELALDANTCYVVAIAWHGEHRAVATVTFQRNPDGSLVSDTAGGATSDMGGGSGDVEFCAERAGKAVLTIEAHDTAGAPITETSLAYAVVLGTKAGATTDAGQAADAPQQGGTQSTTTPPATPPAK